MSIAPSPPAPDGATPAHPRTFGQSLHVDVYDVDTEVCNDLGFFYRLLDDLVAHLRVHAQSPPYIFHSPSADFPDKAGLSGWVPLIESGISVHTLTVKGFVSLDVYTCGELEVDATVRFLTDRLRSSRIELHHLYRGFRYHD
jgi:S-adenosylmethionine decarboxylase